MNTIPEAGSHTTGHTEILHMPEGTGSAALVSVVPYLHKSTQIFTKGLMKRDFQKPLPPQPLPQPPKPLTDCWSFTKSTAARLSDRRWRGWALTGHGFVGNAQGGGHVWETVSQLVVLVVLHKLLSEQNTKGTFTSSCRNKTQKAHSQAPVGTKHKRHIHKLLSEQNTKGTFTSSCRNKTQKAHSQAPVGTKHKRHIHKLLSEQNTKGTFTSSCRNKTQKAHSQAPVGTKHKRHIHKLLSEQNTKGTFTCWFLHWAAVLGVGGVFQLGHTMLGVRGMFWCPVHHWVTLCWESEVCSDAQFIIGSHYAGSQRYVLMPGSSLGHYAGSQRYVLMPSSSLVHYAGSQRYVLMPGSLLGHYAAS